MRTQSQEENSPLVSIVVVNAKGTERLKLCLDAVFRTKYSPFEVIVADCLTANIEQWMSNNFPTVKLVHFDFDIGPSDSHNAGASISTTGSKYVAFLDNDVAVSEDWLGPLVETMEKNGTIGIVQPKSMNYLDPERIDAADCGIDVLGFVHNNTEQGSEDTDDSKEAFYANGCTFLLRKRILSEIHDRLYDPDYFINYDEIDMCWRVRLIGYSIVYTPHSTVYHMRSGPGKMQKSTSIFHNSKNRLMTLMKNYDLTNGLKYIPGLVVLSILEATVLFFPLPRHSLAILRGIWWNITNFRLVYAKRLEVQRVLRRAEDGRILRLMLRPNLMRLFSDFRRHYG